MNLIEKLEKLKTEHGIKSDAEFAQVIGIKPSAYSRLKSGERELTRGQARKVVRRFPELYGAVGSIILQRRG